MTTKTPPAVSMDAILTINRYHRHIPAWIKEGSPDSATLAHVRTVQYNMAVAAAVRAIEALMDLQMRIAENAVAERPCAALDELRDDIGMPHTTVR